MSPSRRHPAATDTPSTPADAERPLVAIVGRPNVGKSTLFNRIIGRREAIVQDEPGTTRDRNYSDVEWEGVPFTLVDTGGLDTEETTGDIEREVQAQARMGIAEADAVLFLVDAVTGATPVDQEVADLLRRAGKPTLVVANKVDNRAREQNSNEFYALGLPELAIISAHHGTGMQDLLDRLIMMLPRVAAHPRTLNTDSVKVAVAGRPNVGKSMLINAILGQERVMVSPVPGTTRDAVDTDFVYGDAEITLIDTAGIRRSGSVQQGVEKYSVMRAVRAINRADVVVLVIDAIEGLTAQDMHVGGYVQEAYKGLVVAVNKWDLSREMELQREEVQRFLTGRLKLVPQAPVVFVSAKDRQGIPQLLDAILLVQNARHTRISTATVNRVVQEAVASHPPSNVHGRQLKVLYATQSEAAPPTFVFFVNDSELMHFSYQRYLENRLRDAFGFPGTPIRMIFKNRRDTPA